MARSEDPDQTAPKEQSDLGLHCLQPWHFYVNIDGHCGEKKTLSKHK